MGNRRGVFGVLVGKTKGKRPLGRRRRRREDNIKTAATWVNTTRYCKYSQVLLMMGENIA